MKKIVLNLGLLGILSLNVFAANDITSLCKEIASNGNKNTPYKLDKITILDSVKCIDNAVVLTNRILMEEANPNMLNTSNKEKKEFNKKIIGIQKNILVDYVCKSKDFKLFIDKGINYSYDYFYQETNEYMGNVTITKNDCNNKKN